MDVARDCVKAHKNGPEDEYRTECDAGRCIHFFHEPAYDGHSMIEAMKVRDKALYVTGA